MLCFTEMTCSVCCSYYSSFYFYLFSYFITSFGHNNTLIHMLCFNYSAHLGPVLLLQEQRLEASLPRSLLSQLSRSEECAHEDLLVCQQWSETSNTATQRLDQMIFRGHFQPGLFYNSMIHVRTLPALVTPLPLL